ncbi:MAG: hypothetical protein ACRELB_22270, partial [Polyangiaceae bacterium]
MRSQIVTLMAPEDEAAFLAFAFERPTVCLIPGVRHPTAEVPHTRDVVGVTSSTCALWDRALLPQPEVEHIPSCDDYCLRSEDRLIQYLRSPLESGSIGTGRIALVTEVPPMAAWFKSLARWIQKHFSNALIYASNFKPEIGSRERTVWAGPHAVELSKRGTKLGTADPHHFSYRPFDPADEERVLAGHRAQKRLLGVGRVTRVGEVVDAQLQKRAFRIRLTGEVPFSHFEGPFMCSWPEPVLGDEVACVFSENIFGRDAAPWEPRELKKLTPRSRDRVLAGLRRAWK